MGWFIMESEDFLAKHDLASLRGAAVFNNPIWWGG
jgi:hypothetical protein